MTEIGKLTEIYIRAKQHAEVMHDVAKNALERTADFSAGQAGDLFEKYVKVLEIQRKALDDLTEALLA